jgi:kumamolisin
MGAPGFLAVCVRFTDRLAGAEMCCAYPSIDRPNPNPHEELTMSNAKKFSLKGTEQAALPGARAVGPTDPHQLIEISIILKNRKEIPDPEEQERLISHSELANSYGADPGNVDKIKQFARDNNLHLLERGDEVLRRTVNLAGTAAAMEKAFSVELIEHEFENGSYRGHNGAIQMPEEFASIVSGVFGLDNRETAQPHFRRRNTHRAFGARSATFTYTALNVARLYGFPQDANGAGQTIGFIELGGGYRQSDLRDYFQGLGLQPPAVKSISVNQACNRPAAAQSVDGAVTLDIEVAAAVAPGVNIAVYFAPNTARGFQDALSTAIHDQLNKPSVLCIGWGNAEVNWAAQSMVNFQQVAKEAALLGITIVAASGDNGSGNGIEDGKSHVDFPASCPYVLAVGGTRLVAMNGNIEKETAWNDGPVGGATGGGFSTIFHRPMWQAAVVTQQGRGVPDVAANADPNTGYNMLVDGQLEVAGGTNAAAPLWAGLIVLLNQKLNRRLGFVNPSLYAIDQSRGFRDIAMGNNGAYTATYGWDCLTGLGSPMGGPLLQALQGQSASARTHLREKAHAGQAR